MGGSRAARRSSAQGLLPTAAGRRYYVTKHAIWLSMVEIENRRAGPPVFSAPHSGPRTIHSDGGRRRLAERGKVFLIRMAFRTISARSESTT